MLQEPGEYNVLAGTRYTDDYNGDVVGLNGIASNKNQYDSILKYASNSSITATATVKGGKNSSKRKDN